MERSLVLVKPDGVQRALIGEVISRLERRGLRLVWEGPNAVTAIRQNMGATRPTEAAPGSLRHDFALEVGRNLTHASDTVENGANEAALWFRQEELVNWTREVDRWVFEK